jgi:hypothetical protein
LARKVAKLAKEQIDAKPQISRRSKDRLGGGNLNWGYNAPKNGKGNAGANSYAKEL